MKPKDFLAAQQAAKLTTPTGSCFVMCPFGGDHDDYHRHIFAPAIEAAGLKATRADDLFRPSPIVADIWSMICECKVGLADVTGRNANVLYELGLAHAITKPVVLVTRSIEDVPFDLRGLRHVTYNVNKVRWADQLQSDITRALSEVLEKPTSCIPLAFVRERPTERPATASQAEIQQLRIEHQLAVLNSRFESLMSARPGRSARIRDDLATKIAERYYNTSGGLRAELYRSDATGEIRGYLFVDDWEIAKVRSRDLAYVKDFLDKEAIKRDADASSGNWFEKDDDENARSTE